MALHRAGLGAGALDNDDSRADGDASAPLRSRPLAAQVRVDATTARERLLLDWVLQSLDFFLTSPISPSSRRLFGGMLTLFTLKSLTADGLAGTRSGVGAESAGRAAQRHLPQCMQLSLCVLPSGLGLSRPSSLVSIASPPSHVAVVLPASFSRASRSSSDHRSHVSHAHTHTLIHTPARLLQDAGCWLLVDGGWWLMAGGWWMGAGGRRQVAAGWMMDDG